PIYWTRWLFYMGSCSILTLDIAFIARIPDSRKVEVALFTGITMFCGFLASFIILEDRWWFFGLSSAAYLGMLYTLFKRYDRSSTSISPIMWFVMVTWSLFPLIWVLAPTGIGFFAADIEAILYLILDFITKIAFGVYITTRNILIE
ncbi:bacteriorhodopsin, partial [Candidatus Bathyarchaeota archaeon]|nr:bacteriorhodopsin [Candidatus Bathyarchaeota archaeon]